MNMIGLWLRLKNSVKRGFIEISSLSKEIKEKLIEDEYDVDYIKAGGFRGNYYVIRW